MGDGQYVELIGVVQPSSDHPVARVLTTMVREGDRPIAVCLRPDDLDATARRLGLEISEGSRTKPDGVELRWRMAGLQEALGPDRLPFFIEWPGGGCNPELDGVTSSVGSGIAWVEFGGDPDRLRAWIGEDGRPITTAAGPVGVARFAIQRNGETLVIEAP